MSAISLDKARVHAVRTPEGISLPFVVAAAGDRAAAFLFDMLLIVLGTVAVWIGAAFSAAVGLGTLGISFALLVGFLLWNFYFIWFEVHRGGLTPGKKKVGLRVIARDGGPLTAEAIFARNLMRNLEFYLPVLVLLMPEATLPEAPGWGRLLAAAWILVFALMPLFNRDRLRCGDLVAGTLVVKAPAAVLLSDLADRGDRARTPRAASEPPPLPVAEFPFTREQLDIYGIHELQVLEDLLRRQDQGLIDPLILEDVCEKIKTKIGWPRERWNVPVRPFLEAFYRAQRGLLEQKMLFGQRRERKRA
ncbi:MAG TPA: RDD family protein [Thermoanaerobaculia bacterium]|nr:RDD family protein [Thermoanaerobaculia bacterium]